MRDGWMGRDIVLYFRPNELTGPTKRMEAPLEADRSATHLSLGPLMDQLPPVRVKIPTELPQSSETPSDVPTFYQRPCVLTRFFPFFSGGGGLAGADPAEAVDPGGAPPAGGAAPVQPEPSRGSD